MAGRSRRIQSTAFGAASGAGGGRQCIRGAWAGDDGPAGVCNTDFRFAIRPLQKDRREYPHNAGAV
jgi:hypothetical protein